MNINVQVSVETSVFFFPGNSLGVERVDHMADTYLTLKKKTCVNVTQVLVPLRILLRTV